MYLRVGLALWMTAGVCSLATVSFRTTIRDVYVEGACEQNGIVTLSINGNDFLAALPADPVYLRIRFTHAGRLCKTLVWSHPSNAGNPSFEPIFIPLAFEENDPGDTIVAPPDTLSLIRWKAGEPEFWLKFQRSSDTWVRDSAGNIGPPDNNRRVMATVGLSARNTHQWNLPMFLVQEANLPATTRGGTDMADAVSTLMCLDLSDSSLQPIPAPPQHSILDIDPLTLRDIPLSGPSSVAGAFDYTDIVQGSGVPISLSGDREIGRGYDFPCTVTTVDDPGPAEPSAKDDLLQLTNTLGIRVQCGAGWGFHTQSQIRLATDPGEAFGFLVATGGDGQPVDYHQVDPEFPPGTHVLLEDALLLNGDSHTLPRAPAGEIFPIPTGDFLTREATVTFTGAGTTGMYDLSLEATVSRWALQGAADVPLQIQVLASNRDSALDIAPYDLVGQERFCDPTLRQVDHGWFLGAFPLAVPALGPLGLAALFAAIALAGVFFLRRTQKSTTP